MKVIEKITKQDESAIITVESVDGDRFQVTLSREDARTGFAVDSQVSVEVTEIQVNEVENQLAPNASNVPSSEVQAMLNDAEKTETDATTSKGSTKVK